MAFDGITISCLKDELRNTLLQGRIYKIAQPENDELRRAAAHHKNLRRTASSGDFCQRFSAFSLSYG